MNVRMWLAVTTVILLSPVVLLRGVFQLAQVVGERGDEFLKDLYDDTAGRVYRWAARHPNVRHPARETPKDH